MPRTVSLLIFCALTLIATAGSAMAGQQKIIIGVTPEVNLVKQMERYTPLAAYLGMRIGVPVELRPLANYGRIYETMRDKEIDAGFFGSFVYAMTHVKIGIEPLVRPQHRDGASSYNGITFVRKESGIRKPADMKGKTIALVDPATTGGYLAQKAFLARHGINIDRDMNILWTGSHEEAITAVLQGHAEIGGAKSLTVRKYRRDNRAFDENLAIIDRTPRSTVPTSALAVRKEFDPELKERMKRALLTMHADPVGQEVLRIFGAARFIETTDADYKTLYDLVDHLKIDLATYPYKKR